MSKMSDLAVIHDKLMHKFNELAVNVLGRLDFEEERVVSNIYLELALMCDLKSLDELTPGQQQRVKTMTATLKKYRALTNARSQILAKKVLHALREAAIDLASAGLRAIGERMTNDVIGPPIMW